MNKSATQEPTVKDLLDRLVAGKQLSATDADTLATECRRGRSVPQTEAEVLQWLAGEYNVGYASLDDVEPDRELLSLFPARILLRDELLPLPRVPTAAARSPSP